MEIKEIEVVEVRVDIQSIPVKVPSDFFEVSEEEQERYLQSRLEYLIHRPKNPVIPKVAGWEEDC